MSDAYFLVGSIRKIGNKKLLFFQGNLARLGNTVWADTPRFGSSIGLRYQIPMPWSTLPSWPGGAALLFLTGMCEYKIEGNGSFLRLK